MEKFLNKMIFINLTKHQEIVSVVLDKDGLRLFSNNGTCCKEYSKEEIIDILNQEN